MGQLDGRVAIVTGGASGIGAACAETLAREGARVVATDVDDAGAAAVVAKVKAGGGEATFLHHDVVDEVRWSQVIAETEKRYGRLDIMVANAGIGISAPSIVDVTMEDWRRQTAINIDGVFLSVKYCIPAMRRGGRGGAIVMISSIAGLRGSASLAGYSATKGAVRLFAKSIALECAGVGDGIRVNSVHPGIIATPIWNKLPPGAMSGGRNAPLDPHELAKTSAPLARAGTAQDIANGVLFLVSDASSYITGAELVIDGGIMAGAAVRRE